jgi:tetratricopeptide (TPR) repeat protein
MKLTARVPVSAALLALLTLSATGCNRLKARAELTDGVAAFKNQHYEEAVNHFQNAIALDPNYETAKLYLATSYAYQVDPNDLTALKQIASIDRNIGKLGPAKDYEKKVIAIAPNDSEAYYTIGVVDWLQEYDQARKILAQNPGGPSGMTDDGNGNVKKSKQACAELQAQNTDLVNEGLDYLQKAVGINPNYDDAMQYLNLTYRRKADLECGNDAARKADLDQADMWTKRAMGARKENEKKLEQKMGGGVDMSK